MEVLVPIVLFVLVFSIPILAVISDGRNKRERIRAIQKALEAGVPLEQVQEALGNEDGKSPRAHRPYQKGLITFAVGGALLLARWLLMGEAAGTEAGSQVHEHSSGLLIAGILCTFLGIAMVLGDFLNRGVGKREGNGGS